MPCPVMTAMPGWTRGEDVSPPINSAVPAAWGAASQPDRQVRVPLGIVVVTRAVDQQLMCREDGRAFVMSCLRRHGQGDWGDLGVHDDEANDLALVTGGRILSSYPIPEQIRRTAGGDQSGSGAGSEAAAGAGAGAEAHGAGRDSSAAIVDERLWIITEAEDGGGVRSQTTVLFPSDY